MNPVEGYCRVYHHYSFELQAMLHCAQAGSGFPFKDGGFFRQHLTVLEVDQVDEWAFLVFQQRTSVAMAAINPYCV